MRSTLGRRASICKELGMSLDYVEHGISYVKLQMMMIDLPRVRYERNDCERITLTDDNADSVWGMFTGMNGVKVNRKS